MVGEDYLTGINGFTWLGMGWFEIYQAWVGCGSRLTWLGLVVGRGLPGWDFGGIEVYLAGAGGSRFSISILSFAA